MYSIPLLVLHPPVSSNSEWAQHGAVYVNQQQSHLHLITQDKWQSWSRRMTENSEHLSGREMWRTELSSVPGVTWSRWKGTTDVSSQLLVWVPGWLFWLLQLSLQGRCSHLLSCLATAEADIEGALVWSTAAFPLCWFQWTDPGRGLTCPRASWPLSWLC